MEQENKKIVEYAKKEEEFERILKLNKIENFDFKKLGKNKKVLTKEYFTNLRNKLKGKEKIKTREKYEIILK